MKYDLFFVSTLTIDDTAWNTFKSRFPLAHKVENVQSFADIASKSFTTFFWVVWNDIHVTDESVFDFTVFPNDTRKIFVFKHGDLYNGISLCSKYHTLTANELTYRVFLNAANIDRVVSCSNFDIVFISYKEPNADDVFLQLQSKFPRAKRIHGITGIHQAHIAAATIATTPMFWVVDGDAIIDDNFKFDYCVPPKDVNAVHVWRSINPVNGLSYGYGGVKLLPRDLTLKLNTESTDMTTSISYNFKAMPAVSNITQFNTDPYNAWKSAFRECVKLSSKVIERQNSVETNNRLDTWCTVSTDVAYAKYAIAGAIAGREYGTLHTGDIDALKKINDFDWLYQRWSDQNL